MLSVRDLLGRSIAELDPLIPLDNGQYFLRLDHLAPGTYLLDLQVGERHWTRRIVRA